MTDFKNKYSFEHRKAESNRILTKYPDRIPIICQKSKSANSTCPIIDKQKYLVPVDLSIGQYMYIIRKRLLLSSEKALYIFINGTIPSVGKLINNIYHEHKDVDGFLYIYYNLENTFG
jgi:GABA(A) receptor-associated protein